MGGGRVVLFIGGALAYADPINAAHAGRVLGLTTQAAAQGDPITVRGTGELLDASFAFAADAPVYVGASGVPTATPPAAAFIQRVGTCIEPGRIRIALAPAILT